MPAVRPEFGPTLPQIAGPRVRALPRALRIGLVAVAVGAVALLAFLALRGEEGQRHVVVREPVAFNFLVREPLARVAPQDGELVRFAARRGEPLASFAVSHLRLPAYRGDSSGFLPVYAEGLARGMEREYDGFAVRQEGRANINRIQGYELIFQARVDGRLAYGRRIMLLPDPTAREGVDITVLGQRTPAVPRADAIGRSGALKTALRSFRLGTERP